MGVEIYLNYFYSKNNMASSSSPAPFDVEFFRDEFGRKPAAEALREMKDPRTVEAIRAKLYDVQQRGLSGGAKPLTGSGAGIQEFRFMSGDCGRVYFVEKPNGIVVLGMSTKKDQDAEIKKCAKRREEYKARTKTTPETDRMVVKGAESVAHLFGDAARKIAVKAGRHAPLIGAVAAGGIAALSSSNPAEAAQAIADATPGLRIASAPNNSERFMRVLGDAGHVFGPVGGLITGAAEEGLRAINDGLKLVGAGSNDIEQGLAGDIAETGAAAAKLAFGNKETRPSAGAGSLAYSALNPQTPSPALPPKNKEPGTDVLAAPPDQEKPEPSNLQRRPAAYAPGV